MDLISKTGGLDKYSFIESKGCWQAELQVYTILFCVPLSKSKKDKQRSTSLEVNLPSEAKHLASF